MNKRIKTHRKDLTQKLKSLRSTNSRDNWKILNGSNMSNKRAVDI